MTDENRIKGRRNQRKGKTAEEIARYLLHHVGVLEVDRIATPVKIVSKRPGGWVKIVWAEKVAGDYRGIIRGGRRVLCEVKRRDRNLRKSDFKEHQLEKLENNHILGGLSPICWVNGEEAKAVLMEWPLPGFEKTRAGLTWEQAESVAIGEMILI